MIDDAEIAKLKAGPQASKDFIISNGADRIASIAAALRLMDVALTYGYESGPASRMDPAADAAEVCQLLAEILDRDAHIMVELTRDKQAAAATC